MNRTKLLIALLLVIPMTASADNSAWGTSPDNWDNSPSNWANSPSNWNNSPGNWNNSPSNFGNTRIIRDESGQPTGYAVPKANGGVNLYAPSGQRTGYLPGR